MGKPKKRVPGEVMELFQRYPWPGNVRQLQNCIERAMVIGSDDEEELQWNDLPPALRLWESAASRETPEDFRLSRALEKVERELLVEALKRSGWVQKKAADLLGISERSMGYRVRKMNISIPDGE
jgi:Nif-specific regulatory protein